MFCEWDITFEELHLTEELVLRWLAATANEQSQQILSHEIHEIFPHISQRCTIRGAYLRIEDSLTVRKQDGILQLENNGTLMFSVGTIVAHQLRAATGLVAFLCTIGDGMERWSKELLQTDDPVKSYIVDRVASFVVECATDTFFQQICRDAESIGKRCTNRFSPGYCGWNVEEQQLLFSLFPRHCCGIVLTDSSLMIPVKSVSGIIGIGKNVTYEDYYCSFCNKKDCLQRILLTERKEIL